MREMANAYKNLNGRDLCMAGGIIVKCILKKGTERCSTQLIWGLLVDCEHGNDCLCKTKHYTILAYLHVL
jgi:hypothetical protein